VQAVTTTAPPADTAAARRSRGWAPWLAAAVAGAVLVALLVVYFVVFLPYRRDHSVGGLSSQEQTALQVASTELDNIGALGGKTFDQDYDRALAGATGPFRSDLLTSRASAKKVLGKSGVRAEVTTRALIGPVRSGGHSGYQLLINLSGPTSSIASVLLSPQQLIVTVLNVGGKWLVDDVSTAGIS